MPNLDASLYSTVRFVTSAVVMLPWTMNKWGHIDLILRSGLVAFLVFMGYFGQSIGMSMGSTANKSAFICSLGCVWVALVQALFQGICRLQTWVSVLLAVTGVAMLELNGSMPISIGDAWLVLQPLGFGSGCILLEMLVADYPGEAAAITGFKILFIGIFSVIWAFVAGKTVADLQPIWHSTSVIASLLYCSVFSTALALWLQSVAFKKVSAKDVAIILSSEPIWATLFSSGNYAIVRFCFVTTIDIIVDL